MLAFETNALKSCLSEGSTPPALARAVYFAILDSGLAGVQSVARAVEDQELAGQVFAELLGIEDYRTKLSDAIKTAVGLGGVKAIPVKDGDEDGDEDVRTAISEMLNGLYAHFHLRLDHANSLPEGVLPFHEVKTVDEKINGLLKMGVSFHSIVLMHALLAKVERDPTVLGQLQMNNPLLRDMLTPVLEEDDGVEFAACRRFHLSQIHDAGSIDGNHGSDDAIRVVAYLYLTDQAIDGNRLVANIIEQSQSADADAPVTKLLDMLETQKLVARTDDGTLAPNGDLNESGADFIERLCSTLKDSQGVMVLYRAFMAIGLEESPKGPETDSQQNHWKCILEARAIASTLENIVSEECQEQMFRLMLPYRNTERTLPRPACNKTPGEGESSGYGKTEAVSQTEMAQAEVKETGEKADAPAGSNEPDSETVEEGDANVSEGEHVHQEAQRLASSEIAKLELTAKLKQETRQKLAAASDEPVVASDVVTDSGDENDDADSVVPEPAMLERAIEGVSNKPQKLEGSDQDASRQTRTSVDSLETKVQAELARQKKQLEAEHVQQIASLKKDHLFSELRGRISAFIDVEERLQNYEAGQTPRKRPHSGGGPAAKRPESEVL